MREEVSKIHLKFCKKHNDLVTYQFQCPECAKIERDKERAYQDKRAKEDVEFLAHRLPKHP